MASLHLPRGPQRIVCLTEEPTEILYALGEQERIVGISAYTVRPSEARRDKPVVSAFVGGHLGKISALEPDLVIGFSDVQADWARDLIAAGHAVLILNQRSIQEILDVVVDLGALVDARPRALELVAGYAARLEEIGNRAASRGTRPRVYFEEWDEPTICGIRWVSELIAIAGGEDIFADKAAGSLARERFVDAGQIAERNPELILASWCGKPLDRHALMTREGLEEVDAVVHDRVTEVPAEIILQPGPACLTDGLDFLVREIESVARASPA
jgi:iron complex transport system substrate-binding protein